MTLIRDRAVGQDTEQSLKPVKRHRSLFWVQLWEETQRTRSGRLNRRSTDSDSLHLLNCYLKFCLFTQHCIFLYFFPLCVCACMCTLAHVCAHTHVCSCSLESEHICECQRTTSSIGLHLSLWMTLSVSAVAFSRSPFLGASGTFPVSTSHLAVAVMEFQMCTTMSAVPGCWRSEPGLSLLPRLCSKRFIPREHLVHGF